MSPQPPLQFENLPEGWEPSVVVNAIRRNRDGSITALVRITLRGDRGSYSGSRKVVLTHETNPQKGVQGDDRRG